MPTEKPYYTIEEVAPVMGFTEQETVEWIERRLVPAHFVRGEWHVNARWWEKHRLGLQRLTDAMRLVDEVFDHLTTEEIVAEIRKGRRRPPWANEEGEDIVT